MSNAEQLEKIKNAPGFIAALDQSGGSTPKALGLYGVTPDAWSNDDEMFDVVHAMRTRIMTSPSFGGDRILGAILFENTMDREIEGQPTASYLWDVKNVVPILKVDLGLADDALEFARRKLEINREKYPANVVRGRSLKYTEYENDE